MSVQQTPRNQNQQETRQLRVTLVRSLSGQRKANRETIRSLGLGRIGSSTLRADSDCLRGMLRKVAHLVTVEEVLSQ